MTTFGKPKTVMIMTLLEATGFGNHQSDFTFRGYPDGKVYMERKWIYPTEDKKSRFDLTDQGVPAARRLQGAAG